MPNPDLALIARLMEAAAMPAPLDSSPACRMLGARLEAADREGGMVLGFTFTDEMVQGNGVVLGGMISAALDLALTLCPFPMLPAGIVAATTHLDVSYLRPCGPGPVTVRAQADRMGRTVGFTRGELQDGEGRVIATGAATLAVFADPFA